MVHGVAGSWSAIVCPRGLPEGVARVGLLRQQPGLPELAIGLPPWFAWHTRTDGGGGFAPQRVLLDRKPSQTSREEAEMLLISSFVFVRMRDQGIEELKQKIAADPLLSFAYRMGGRLDGILHVFKTCC